MNSKPSSHFFPGRFSIDRMVNGPSVEDVQKKRSKFSSQDSRSGLFSQSSQPHSGVSSYESSNTPASNGMRTNSRYDEVVSVNRHKEIVDALQSISSSLMKLESNITQQFTLLKQINTENQTLVVSDLQQLKSVKSDEKICSVPSDFLENMLSAIDSVKFLILENGTKEISAAKTEPIDRTPICDVSDSESEDGVSLSQYMSVKNRTTILSVGSTSIGKHAQNVTEAIVPVAPTEGLKKVQQRAAQPPSPTVSKKRVRTATSKMADLRLESQNKSESFLFSSYSFDAVSPEPKKPRQVAARSTTAVSQSQSQATIKQKSGVRGQDAASATVSAARLTSCVRQQMQTESQMTELPSDDDDNTTSGGHTFNEDDDQDDDDYMTEPLFYA